MQLRLSGEEWKLLAEMLENRQAEKGAVGDFIGRRSSVPKERDSGPMLPDLWQHAVERQPAFSSEELETLAGLLGWELIELRERISRGPQADRAGLDRKQALLQNLFDKVTEACAMA